MVGVLAMLIETVVKGTITDWCSVFAQCVTQFVIVGVLRCASCVVRVLRRTCRQTGLNIENLQVTTLGVLPQLSTCGLFTKVDGG